MSIESVRDPRARLVREKYFSLRPRPLERWLWAQAIPASAERVFWLHWQEGMKRGDWCSEVPIKRVAADCHLDVSTVTRAYQLLAKLGCLQRTDPGRDPANPFQQATALTEVRVPRALLAELDRHPNRREPAGTAAAAEAEPLVTAEVPAALENKAADDPFAGLSGRERLRMLAALTRAMSAAERAGYDEALRVHRAHMSFDVDTRAVGGRAGQGAAAPVGAGRLAPRPRQRAARDRGIGAGAGGARAVGVRARPAAARRAGDGAGRRCGRAAAPGGLVDRGRLAAPLQPVARDPHRAQEDPRRGVDAAEPDAAAVGARVECGVAARGVQPCITKKGSLRDLFTEDYSSGRWPVG